MPDIIGCSGTAISAHKHAGYWQFRAVLGHSTFRRRAVLSELGRERPMRIINWLKGNLMKPLYDYVERKNGIRMKYAKLLAKKEKRKKR